MMGQMAQENTALEDHKIECSNLEKDQILMENLPQEKKSENGQSSSSSVNYPNNKDELKIVISREESCSLDESKLDALRITGTKISEISDVARSPKKGSLSRIESSREQCRVCQQSSDEALIDLGCHCRGGLAKAHLSCIGTWFSTKGSNKCEICQQIAVNVPPPPESQPSRNYWIWRFDPTAREHERGCYSPLWVALSILIGGLLLDVLISISLGVSAFPVNIIIGVLVVLGLGTAVRLAFECCQEISTRRRVLRMQNENHAIWQNL